MSQSLGPINWIALLLLGASLLVSLRLIYGSRSVFADDPIKRSLTVVGWLAIVIGFVGLLWLFLAWFALFVGVMALMVAITTVARYRAAQRRALLAALTIAAERSVPLDLMVKGVADQGAAEMRFRAATLAYLLQAGVPLPEALSRSRYRLAIGESVAIRFGYATGTLGEGLRQLSADDDRLRASLRGVLEKYLYISLIVSASFGVIVFMMFRIVPVLGSLAQDFEIGLTPLMDSLIVVSDSFVNRWYLTVPFWLLWIGALGLGLIGYLGWLPLDFPLIGRIALPFDGIHVMRALATGTRLNRPIGETVDRLSQLYPRARVRRRLAAAGDAIRLGRDWCDSLMAVGLLRYLDAAVLRAAERAGNLAWALEEMAHSRLRRTTYRLTLWFHSLFPIAVVGLGLAVLLIAYSLINSLVRLMESAL